MVRVIAALAADNQRTRKFWMPELTVRPFSTGNECKPRLLQVSDQLAYLARHTPETATCIRPLPASIPAPLKLMHDASGILMFHMGKNTPERRDFIMGNLVVVSSCSSS